MNSQPDGIIFNKNFVKNPDQLFNYLIQNINWDERMKARKTASYGVAYNYSQMSYPFQEFLPELVALNQAINLALDFTPNNCLINYYLNGKSKMGFHSDQTDILQKDTGIAIVSLGQSRVLRFREIADHENTMDYTLPPGSLFYMSQEVQKNWQHAIPMSNTQSGRISLTFRHILS